jgi:hypothetical protein
MNEIKQAIKTAIYTVADARDCQPTWMNDDCMVFTGGRKRRPALFSAALQQNTVLWNSTHLTIYAGEWRWALGLKLRRIAESRSRADLDDAVCILNELGTCYGPVSEGYIESLIPNQKPLLDLIVQTYEAKYGKIAVE